MSLSGDVAQGVLEATKPALSELVLTVKDQFMADFGDWVKSEHRPLLEKAFLGAAQAKLDTYMAKTATDALESHEVYDTCVASLETLGLDVKIMAEVEARRLLILSFERVISLIPVVAGTVVKIALGFVPVAGGLAGPIAGAGVEFILKEFFG